MALACCLKTVQRVHHGSYRAIEPKGHGCRLKVIVNRFRHADNVKALVIHLQGGG